MRTIIKTYRQDRPADWLRENPNETWRCDIYAEGGSEHHGIGSIEADALLSAATNYAAYFRRPTPPAPADHAPTAPGPNDGGKPQP